MFDIGMAEMMIVGGAAILLLGKNDMPLVFRLVGRGVGKVSGLVQGGQARMSELSKGSELLQLQNEIRSNLDDLRVIKAELRGTVRLPGGITGSSHPGSSALRGQHKLPGQVDQPDLPPSPYNNNASAAGYVSPGGGGQYSDSLTGAATVPTATTASAIRPPTNELPAAMRPPGVSSGRLFETPAATTLEERAFGGGTEETAGGVAGVGDGDRGRVGDGFREREGVKKAAPSGVGVGVGSGVAAGVGAGMGAGVRTAVPQAVKSIVSPGGDRLQRLAMAEIGFAEKELYAPKTDALPGGADILNETITDSLLQERYRQMLEVARGSKSNDGADKPQS